MDRMYRIFATAIFLRVFIGVCLLTDTFLNHAPDTTPTPAASIANNLP